MSLAALQNGEILGYDLFDVKEGKVSPFIRKEGAMNWEKFGPHFFVPEALKEAKRKILHCREDNFLIVDEVGPLEILGRGVWPALQVVLSKPSLCCLLVVRRGILEDFRNLLKAVPLKIFDIENPSACGLLRKEIQKAGRAKKRKVHARSRS